MKIDEVTSIGLHFVVNTKDDFVVIQDLSGSGKGLLFDYLFMYFTNYQSKICTVINYKNCKASVAAMTTIIAVSDVIICDNADLYMTTEVWQQLKHSGKIVFISIKRRWLYEKDGCSNLYAVRCKDNLIELRG